MSESIEDLERRWLDTKLVGDEAAHLRAMVRAGLIDQRRIDTAAALGHPAAAVCQIEHIKLSAHFRTALEEVLENLEPIDSVRFAASCAGRAVGVWETVRATDARPRVALEAAVLWLGGKLQSPLEALEEAAAAAAAAGIEADDPDKVPGDVELTSAIDGAHAAEHAATAALEAERAARGLDTELGGVSLAASYSGRFGFSAAARPDEERNRQFADLIALLLRRSVQLPNVRPKDQ